jgi:hypothetical protein
MLLTLRTQRNFVVDRALKYGAKTVRGYKSMGLAADSREEGREEAAKTVEALATLWGRLMQGAIPRGSDLGSCEDDLGRLQESAILACLGGFAVLGEVNLLVSSWQSGLYTLLWQSRPAGISRYRVSIAKEHTGFLKMKTVS